jgi:ferric hydroxamate transport system substrate-binding protein
MGGASLIPPRSATVLRKDAGRKSEMHKRGMNLTRRAVLQGMSLPALAACAPAPAGLSRGGVAALDWALAETMIALGEPPAGVVAAADWRRFVVEPALPDGVTDLGLQQELNFELIAALRPRLILISPFLERFKPKLDRIAPSVNLSVYEHADTPLANRIRITRKLASHIDAEHAADAYISALDALRDEAEARLSRLKRRPVLLVSFIDNRHARVYGGSSLYADTLAWLGLQNGWRKPVGYFGFATVGLEDLATAADVELIAVEPVPPDISRALSSSPLWTELPFVKAGREGRIPPVFMFGALPSAQRFAKLLLAYLETKWDRA